MFAKGDIVQHQRTKEKTIYFITDYYNSDGICYANLLQLQVDYHFKCTVSPEDLNKHYTLISEMFREV